MLFIIPKNIPDFYICIERSVQFSYVSRTLFCGFVYLTLFYLFTLTTHCTTYSFLSSQSGRVFCLLRLLDVFSPCSAPRGTRSGKNKFSKKEVPLKERADQSKKPVSCVFLKKKDLPSDFTYFCVFLLFLFT